MLVTSRRALTNEAQEAPRGCYTNMLDSGLRQGG